MMQKKADTGHHQECEHLHGHDHGHTHGHEHAHGMHQHDGHEHDNCCSAESGVGHDHPDTGAGNFQAADTQGLLLHVPAMDCAVEEQEIRQALQSGHGLQVDGLSFDLVARTVFIQAPESAWEGIRKRIAEAGFPNTVLQAAAPAQDIQKLQKRELTRNILALVVASAAELVHLLLGHDDVWIWVGMSLAALAILLSGFSVLAKGLASLRRLRLNINALMTVAVIGAFAIGDWPEAAMVMALYSIAELIEARAVGKARNAIAGLLDLAPAQATVQQQDESWAVQAVETVPVGAVVRVKPGERFAFDAVVLEGNSVVDQSAITGESVGVDKGPGDSVYAGTVNQNAELIIKVASAASDTVLAKIIEAVEQAQASRAPIQRFVDRFAQIYTPAVFVLALLVVLNSALLMGESWNESIYRGLVMLVIACPCALVISTPVTIVSGLTAATRMGVLVKGGVFLELFRKLKVLAVDKTGTLTEGKPTLVAWEFLEKDIHRTNQDRVLGVARAMASRSDHPVSMAIAKGLDAFFADALRKSILVADREQVGRFEALAGKGVQAIIAGRTYRLGNHRWMHELGLCSTALEDRLHDLENQGQTVSMLADDERVHAIFGIADVIRPSARQAVEALKEIGVDVVMLTGDNQRTATVIARQAGIDQIKADLLPQEKLDTITKLAAPAGQVTAMVGDGINDAPALAQADIGIAMGRTGTDIAVNAADVVLMTEDLGRLRALVRLSQKVHKILWQNITLALGIKAVFLVLALMGQATMWMAVFADMGASLIVVANGLRVLNFAKDGAPDQQRSGN